MRQVEDECCGCATESYPCRGDMCPNRHAVHLYCDICHSDVDKLYEYDGSDYCEECLLEQFDSIDIDTADWRDIEAAY